MLSIVNLVRRILVLDRSRRADIETERLARRIDEDYRRQQQHRSEDVQCNPQTCTGCGGGGACPVCAGRPISWSTDGRQEVCGACGGSGRCPACNGTGQWR